MPVLIETRRALVETRRVHIQSTKTAHAPTIVDWAANAYTYKQDRQTVLKEMMREWKYELTKQEWHRVLSLEVPYTIEYNFVVIYI